MQKVKASDIRADQYDQARAEFNDGIKRLVEAGVEIKVILAGLLDTTTVALLNVNEENRVTLAELLHGIADSLVAFHAQDPDRE